MIYAVLSLVALIAIASLCVDFGIVQTSKRELQDATDAAARYAAAGVRSEMQGTSGATANATASFLDNSVNGGAVTFNPATDLQTGVWSTSTRSFTPATVDNGANAVRLNTQMTLGTSAHPLPFLQFFNRSVTVHAVSIAMIRGQDTSTDVSAKGNPWLAGMPNGTVSQNFRSDSSEWDTAGSGPNVASSPASIALSTLNVNAGQTINVDGVTGATDFGGGTTGNADGNAGLMVTLGSPQFNDSTYLNSPTNGMSNAYIPINAMVGVFLDDNAPNSTPAPTPPLDFSSAASRDYISVSPKLKQVFFIGDGRRSNGEIQQIVVPTGATRFFIANMDGWQYNNNTGGFNLTIHANHQIISVQFR
ncbi:MAG: pilus assembly protein TadG-related protein [Tepidisphaeraceae bacterium]